MFQTNSNVSLNDGSHFSNKGNDRVKAIWSFLPQNEQSSQVTIPPRALNGGLYTGEPFQKNAPWANVPAIPDVDFLTQHRVADDDLILDEARFQYPGTVRPGNNNQSMPGVTTHGPHGFSCIKDYKCQPATWSTCRD
jgi:hypothetical protein